MENLKDEQCENDDIVSKNYEHLESEKEKKLVNLMIEIIVSLTLKELYEESDQIFKIQSIGAKQWID